MCTPARFSRSDRDEPPGGVAIFSGCNRGKIDRIIAALEAGLHVLADKPAIIEPADLPRLESGKAAAKSVMAAVAAHREEFEFDHHCGGPNLDATTNDIIGRIERYSGVKLANAFSIPDLDREVKWHCRYGRQNGIHVSPTFMIDGLVHPDMSSGDPIADWVSRLLK
jgi:hypothetical protein